MNVQETVAVIQLARISISCLVEINKIWRFKSYAMLGRVGCSIPTFRRGMVWLVTIASRSRLYQTCRRHNSLTLVTTYQSMYHDIPQHLITQQRRPQKPRSLINGSAMMQTKWREMSFVYKTRRLWLPKKDAFVLYTAGLKRVSVDVNKTEEM